MPPLPQEEELPLRSKNHEANTHDVVEWDSSTVDENSPLLAPPDNICRSRSTGSSHKHESSRRTILFQGLQNTWFRWWFRIGIFCITAGLLCFHAIHQQLVQTHHNNTEEDSNPAPRVFFVARSTTCPARFGQSGVAAKQTRFVGNASRESFADRLDENLVLCETFDNDDSWKHIFQADKSLFGEGNGGFAYYTPENVILQDGTLQLKPDLFANLGPITTQDGHTHDASQVMVGNCTPFPSCATLDLTDQNCTIAEFSGCQRIGTPLVTLNPVTSGRVNTKERFEMLYGRLEAHVRLPQGDWLWPALWLMPVNKTDYGNGWPDSGEFDLMESKGNDPNVYGRDCGYRDTLSSCLHYHGNSWWKTYTSLSANEILTVCRNGTIPLEDCDWSTDFFTIGLYWSPSTIYAYVVRDEGIQEDGLLVQEEVKLWEVNAAAGFGPDDYPNGFNYPPFFEDEIITYDTNESNPLGPYAVKSSHKDAPFDKPFYLIINLAVGGEINGCPNPGYWGWDALWCTEQPGGNGTEQVPARTVFWDHKDLWYPSWQEAERKQRGNFVIDWVKVWQ